MPNPSDTPNLRISNRAYGNVAVSATIGSAILLAFLILLLGQSGGLVRADAGAARTAIIIVVLGLVVWIGIASIVFAFTRIVLWMDFGNTVTYRCLVGERRLPWSDIVRLDVTVECGGEAALINGLFGFDGELTLVRRDGARLTVRFTANEREHVNRLVQNFNSVDRDRPIRLPWWTSLGFCAVGSIALALGVYIDYLLYVGRWEDEFVRAFGGIKWRILMESLPFVVPAIGIVACVYGLRQLFSSHSPR